VLTGHTRKPQQPALAGTVVNADMLQLFETINQRYDQVSSITATMDFTVSVSGTHRGERTDYTSCLGFILFR
jgi:hypothetical protein